MVLQKARDFESNKAASEVFNFNDIAAEADALLKSAKQQADEIINNAQQKAKQLYEQAKEDGFNEGKKEGVEEGKKQGHQLAHTESQEQYAKMSEENISLLKNIFEAIENQKHQILWDAEQDMVKLSLEIAKKVIKISDKFHVDIALENIKSAIELVGKKTDIEIKLHPDDLSHIETLTNQREQYFGDYGTISFISDEAISRGGCLLVTSDCQVDSQLETQIERIADAMIMDTQTSKE